MAIYTPASISGYNSSPPTDDGAETAANQGTWAGVKSKLADPIKVLGENINSAANTAFSQVGNVKGTGEWAKTFSSNGLTVTFASDSKSVMIRFAGWNMATDGSDLWLQFKVADTVLDGATDYKSAAYTINDAGTPGSIVTSGDTKIVLAENLGFESLEDMSGDITIHDPVGANSQTSVEWNVGYRDAAGLFTYSFGSGQYTTAQTVEDAFISLSTGDMTSVKYQVYNLV